MLSILLHSRWSSLIVRIGLGALFLWAGAVKIMAPKAFARIIAGYEILPDFLLPPLAILLPLLEIAAGIGLIANIRGSLHLTFGLLIAFLGALGVAIWGGLDVDCGCLSMEELGQRSSLKVAFARDMVLVGLVFYLAWVRKRGPVPEMAAISSFTEGEWKA